jgi:conjugal transfer pilus assembly protein TraB
MKTIKELFRNLGSKEKSRIVKTIIGLVLVVIVFSAYQFTKNKDKSIKTRTDIKKNTLKFDERTFEKTIYNKTQADVEGLRKELENFKKEINNILSQQKQEAEKKARYGANSIPNGFPDKNSDKKSIRKKPAKNLSMASALPLPVIGQSQSNKVPEPNKSLSGDRRTRIGRAKNNKKDPPIKQIAVFENPHAAKGDLQASEDIKVHLPPSFMEANLLNGVTAPATDVGKNNPIPMLIRVNNLAVLPNNVKSNTKGCFVVAEGYGSLADERVHARLLSLSCINQKGGTVIDQPIKGFVVDTDGKEGMKGHVYAKFGQQIARVAIAGFLEGLGSAMTLGQQEFTYGVNTGVRSGQFKDTDAETLARAGFGQGIVNVAEDLQKFYLDLAEQSLPVIEVHPTKNITIVISEGVDIAIKKQETSKVELEG